MRWFATMTAALGTVLLACGHAAAEEVSLTLSPPAYQIVRDGQGVDRVRMGGYRNGGAPGDPVLPSRVFSVLVSPGIDWDTLELTVEESVVEVLPGPYALAAGGPDTASVDGALLEDWGAAGARALSEDGRNPGVYERDAFFPGEAVQMLPYSRMRAWRFVRVRFHPFQYNPKTGELRLTRRARLTVRYGLAAGSQESVAPEDAAREPLVSALAHNYASGRAGYRSAGDRAASAAASSDYVVVVSNDTAARSEALAGFVAHKQARGHGVRLVTESDFSSVQGQAPNRRAEKIRQWLMDHYRALGIRYVLLIGDPSPHESGEGDIPMKMCWPRRGAGFHEQAPTDAFYADLTGDWDADGDGYFGEWEDYATPGGVDFSPEVWVGRIPVYNGDTGGLDAILRKIVDYENAGAAAWRKNVLLPMSFSTPTYDGAPLAEQMVDDYLQARDFAAWTQYQQGSGACGLDSVYDSPEELAGGTAVRDRWAAGAYGIVAWWGHGSVTAASVGAEGCWDGTLFSRTQNASLSDETPAFTFQCSCTNGYPENALNLQYALLQRGGIGTVSASRVSWFNTETGYGQFDGSSTNAGIAYEYVDRLTQALPAGQALCEAKLAVAGDVGSRNTRLMNQYGFNLYGDPSLTIGGCRTDAECDDGRWCNGLERCDGGLCAAGTPVDCGDGNACTDDACDDTLDRCTHACAATDPEAPCCQDAACAEEAVCNDTCVDRDGDGYGNPASAACRFVDLDCDDTDPAVNPGMTEILDNGIDDDCRPEAPPAWGTPSSVLGEAYSRPTDPANALACLLLLPGLAVVLLRLGLRRR